MGAGSQHWAAETFLNLSCPDLDLESPRQCRNLESQEISCKQRFWIAGQLGTWKPPAIAPGLS